MPGIVYLVQSCELIGTDRYKIGMSRVRGFKRIYTGYKNGSKWISVNEVEYPLIAESAIKDIFNEKFKLIAGNEYFEGKIKEIFDTYINIISYFNFNMIEKPNTLKCDKCNITKKLNYFKLLKTDSFNYNKTCKLCCSIPRTIKKEVNKNTIAAHDILNNIGVNNLTKPIVSYIKAQVSTINNYIQNNWGETVTNLDIKSKLNEFAKEEIKRNYVKKIYNMPLNKEYKSNWYKKYDNKNTIDIYKNLCIMEQDINMDIEINSQHPYINHKIVNDLLNIMMFKSIYDKKIIDVKKYNKNLIKEFNDYMKNNWWLIKTLFNIKKVEHIDYIKLNDVLQQINIILMRMYGVKIKGCENKYNNEIAFYQLKHDYYNILFTKKKNNSFKPVIKKYIINEDTKNTPLKTEVVNDKLPSYLLFMKKICEYRDYINKNKVDGKTSDTKHQLNFVLNDTIIASVLYGEYRKWCNRNGEKIVTGARFYKSIKCHKKRTKNGSLYNISTYKLPV